MIQFEADVEIPVKAKMEEVRMFKIPNDDPFVFFKEYRPESEEYILFTCEDGWVVVTMPKDKIKTKHKPK